MDQRGRARFCTAPPLVCLTSLIFRELGRGEADHCRAGGGKNWYSIRYTSTPVIETYSQMGSVQ